MSTEDHICSVYQMIVGIHDTVCNEVEDQKTKLRLLAMCHRLSSSITKMTKQIAKDHADQIRAVLEAKNNQLDPSRN